MKIYRSMRRDMVAYGAARLILLSLALVASWSAGSASATATPDSNSNSAQCLGCHDYGEGSPIHPLLASKHGQADDAHSPMAQQGCASCHGASEGHTRAPTRVAPGVSFGPRWTASVVDQDSQCLRCHADDEAKHWQGGTHQAADLSCVTCHDMHTSQDQVLQSGAQLKVCTTCHKPQQQGIHALKADAANDPACSDCHSGHADANPLAKMLANRSLGCRECHDLVSMASDSTVSSRATSYHKTMALSDRTCIDCHQGIAHSPAEGVAPVIREALASREVSLFYPGQSDGDWLLAEHPGSQSFRQGRNCQQCHRGDENEMGRELALEGIAPLRQLTVSFRPLDQGLMGLRIFWNGTTADQDVALMWGGPGNVEFRAGGCWAACHSDMPGMSRDRGQQQGKYLAVSRAQMQRIGVPAQTKSAAELAALLAEGNYVDVIRVQLNGGKGAKLEVARLLNELDWQTSEQIKATAEFQSGRWTVDLQLPRATAETTFGIALHTAGQSGAGHWVSLPQTFAPAGQDTDFRLP